MVEKIIALLGRLTGVYDRLYEMSKQKQEYIIANEADKVSDIVKEEYALVQEAAALENERNAAVLATLPGGEEMASLRELVKVAAPQQKQKLVQAAEGLREVVERQKKINAENQSLIELHLEYMDYMINTVLKAPEVSSIYGNSGTVDESGIDNRSILDSEA